MGVKKLSEHPIGRTIADVEAVRPADRVIVDALKEADIDLNPYYRSKDRMGRETTGTSRILLSELAFSRSFSSLCIARDR